MHNAKGEKRGDPFSYLGIHGHETHRSSALGAGKRTRCMQDVPMTRTKLVLLDEDATTATTTTAAVAVAGGGDDVGADLGRRRDVWE